MVNWKFVGAVMKKSVWWIVAYLILVAIGGWLLIHKDLLACAIIFLIAGVVGGISFGRGADKVTEDQGGKP